jgi:nicotinamide mononucleotide (NMN) deamidase PncC
MITQVLPDEAPALLEAYRAEQVRLATAESCTPDFTVRSG